MLRSTVLCAALAAALPCPSGAASGALAALAEEKPKAPALGVGDPAPALAIAKWVKGEPVERFEKGKVYMVEFWATWCAPCIASMPHLTALQQKHKDKGLTIVSVSAADGRGNGIPCSFLVDGNGRIAYIGHPMGIDATLESVVAGKHDIEALAAAHKREKELELRASEYQRALNMAAGKGDWETALKACDDMLGLDADKFGGIAAAKFQILVREVKDEERAYSWARAAFAGPCRDSADGLHALAWSIVDPDLELAKRDSDLAIELAARAVELSKSKDASILDTLARAWFVKGDLAKAVEFERKAAALDKRFAATLKEYEDALAKRGN
jgi:tetratricopeptide (TPR) repeat protein